MKKIKLGISIFPPLVMRAENKKYTGFEIELWEKIAQQNQWSFAYQETKFKNLIKKVRNKEVDLAIAGISRTTEREKICDFSYSTLRSGLLIMISKKSKINLFSFLKNIIVKNTKNLAIIILIIAAIIFISAQIIYALEKNNGVFSNSYLKGMGEAIWWAIVTIGTVGYGDFVPQTLLGRVVGAVVIFMGFSFSGLFVAKLSSLFTLEKMRYQINSINDLRGKKVATQEHTFAEEELNKMGIKLKLVDEIEDAYPLLEKGLVDAIIFDAPVIKYFLHHEETDKFVSTGKVFAHHRYAFLMPEKSKLRESINQTLIQLEESGEYNELYKKWFGDI